MTRTKINWTRIAAALSALNPCGPIMAPDGSIYGPDGVLLLAADELAAPVRREQSAPVRPALV